MLVLSCSVMSESLRSHGLQPTLLCPWDTLDKNTRVGCQALLQRIFPTQGLNHVSCTAGSQCCQIYNHQSHMLKKNFNANSIKFNKIKNSVLESHLPTSQVFNSHLLIRDAILDIWLQTSRLWSHAVLGFYLCQCIMRSFHMPIILLLKREVT